MNLRTLFLQRGVRFIRKRAFDEKQMGMGRWPILRKNVKRS